MTADKIAEALTGELRAQGISEVAPSGIHSWRCEYPDHYGKCNCFTELVTDLAAVLEPLIAARIDAERERIADAIEAEYEDWRLSGLTPIVIFPLHSAQWHVRAAYQGAAALACTAHIEDTR